MTDIVLACEALNKSYGGIAATDNVGLDVERCEIHAVIGPNGAGKTTLISQLSGDVMPDSGRITFEGRDITRLPAHRRSLRGLARSFQITSIFENMSVLDNTTLAVQAHEPARALSHGEHRQLEIAMALATGPSLLLLDEPMAGMGPEESATMVETLKGLKKDKTILLIEHDMDAVFALADRITVLVYGRVIASGKPDEIRSNEAVRKAYLGDEGS